MNVFCLGLGILVGVVLTTAASDIVDRRRNGSGMVPLTPTPRKPEDNDPADWWKRGEPAPGDFE